MSRMPRILPLAGIAVVGVLAINVASGAKTIPNMFSGAKAFAEGLAGAPATPPPTANKPAPVCAPTAAELAKEAGLSPAELQTLQSLGIRRGELDQRETDVDTNQQLLAAAAAKLDERVKALGDLKDQIQGLLVQADDQQKAENARLITVFSAMKPKDAAARMTALDDAVLVPIAAGMKERTLAAIIAQMQVPDAKKLTENLARRYAASQAIKNAQAAIATPPAAGAPSAGGPALAGAQASITPPAMTPDPIDPTAAKPVIPKPAAAKPRPSRKPTRKPGAAAAKPAGPAAAPAEKPAVASAAAGDTSRPKPAAATPAVAPPKAG